MSLNTYPENWRTMWLNLLLSFTTWEVLDQALCNIQREVIRGIALKRLRSVWSVQPQTKPVYNTDFKYKIHNVLPKFLWGFSNRNLWSVLMGAVNSGVVLLVMSRSLPFLCLMTGSSPSRFDEVDRTYTWKACIHVI